MKKIPQRSCAICREKKDKNELIRIVKNKENEVKIDQTGKQQGRGAYMCSNVQCIEKAKKNKGLERSLDIKIEESIYDELIELINRG